MRAAAACPASSALASVARAACRAAPAAVQGTAAAAAAPFPAALFPQKLPEGADYDKFIATVKSNEIIRGKLLSDDGTLALIVLAVLLLAHW